MTSIASKKDDNIGEWVNLTEDGGVRRCRTRAGTGARPKRGQKIAIHYTGKLDDGTVFATSREEGEPLDFVVGKEELLCCFIEIAWKNNVNIFDVKKFDEEAAYHAEVFI